jgi:hypothetical protein
MHMRCFPPCQVLACAQFMLFRTDLGAERVCSLYIAYVNFEVVLSMTLVEERFVIKQSTLLFRPVVIPSL